MEGVGGQTGLRHRVAPAVGRTDLPGANIGPGSRGLRHKEFDTQLERVVAQAVVEQARADDPTMRGARRHDLELSLDPLANLFAHEVTVHGRHRAVFESFLQLSFDLRFNRRVVDRRLERAARDQHLVAQLLLRFRRQLPGAPLHQEIHGGAGDRQQQKVHEHDAGPFAQPDFPARDRFHGHHLHLALLDIARQGAARQPERRESKQRGDGAKRVGQQNLREALCRAVVFDDHRQPDDRAEQQHRQNLHEPITERGFQSQLGHGEQALHEKIRT